MVDPPLPPPVPPLPLPVPGALIGFVHVTPKLPEPPSSVPESVPPELEPLLEPELEPLLDPELLPLLDPLELPEPCWGSPVLGLFEEHAPSPAAASIEEERTTNKSTFFMGSVLPAGGVPSAAGDRSYPGDRGSLKKRGRQRRRSSRDNFNVTRM
jgi:hypothetical protein